MDLILLVAGSIGLVLGSALCGLLIGMAVSAVGRGCHHPACGPLLALLLVPLAFQLPANTFIDMTIVFAFTSAAVFWAMSPRSDPDHAR